MKQLCTSILTLCSLLPGTIELGGLARSSSCVAPKCNLERKFSGDIELMDGPTTGSPPGHEPFFTKVRKTSRPTDMTDGEVTVDDGQFASELDTVPVTRVETDATDQLTRPSGLDSPESFVTRARRDQELDDDELAANSPSPQPQLGRSFTPPLLKLGVESCGLPLHIFRRGVFCHPYLSLTYLDVLNDPRVGGFVIGATNYLFKQKRELFDVVVELDGAKVDIVDPELRKTLSLSTEDLRFADYLVKNTLECSNTGVGSGIQSNLLDGTSWEGGDEWLRYQFKIYLLHLLRTSECDGKYEFEFEQF